MGLENPGIGKSWDWKILGFDNPGNWETCHTSFPPRTFARIWQLCALLDRLSFHFPLLQHLFSPPKATSLPLPTSIFKARVERGSDKMPGLALTDGSLVRKSRNAVPEPAPPASVDQVLLSRKRISTSLPFPSNGHHKTSINECARADEQ